MISKLLYLLCCIWYKIFFLIVRFKKDYLWTVKIINFCWNILKILMRVFAIIHDSSYFVCFGYSFYQNISYFMCVFVAFFRAIFSRLLPMPLWRHRLQDQVAIFMMHAPVFVCDFWCMVPTKISTWELVTNLQLMGRVSNEPCFCVHMKNSL